MSLHLVLVTRRDPALNLLQLRAYRQIGELRAQALCFTVDETETFLQQALNAPVEEAVAITLTERTEGWVTALHLMTLSMHDSAALDDLTVTLPGEQQTLEYLLAEALSRQPREIQTWLFMTSILDRFCAPLCDTVCTLPEGGEAPNLDGGQFIQWLSERNLFVISLDQQQYWFRYHHLFQELLHNQLENVLDKDEIAEMHARASAWFAGNDLIEEALQHALAAGDKTEAMRLFERQRYDLINTEQWIRLERLLHMLPPEVLEDNPLLLFTKAYQLDYRGEMGKVYALLAQAKPLVDAVRPQSLDYKRIHGEYNTLLAEQQYLAAEGKLAVRSAETALDLLPAEAQFIRYLAMNWLVFSLQMIGEMDESKRRVQEGLFSASDPRSKSNFRGHRNLCGLYFIEGDLRLLEQFALNVLEFGEKNELPESLGMAGYHLGMLHYFRNELTEAARYTGINIKNRYIVRSVYYAQCVFVQAYMHVAQDQPELAWQAIESVLTFAEETENDYVKELARAFRVELALRQNRLQEAGRLMQGVNFDLLPPIWFLYHSRLTLAKALIALGGTNNYREAAERLDQYNEFGKRTHNNSFLIQVLDLQALLHDAQGEEAAALLKLSESLALARPGGFIRTYVDLGQPMARLLRRFRGQDNATGLTAYIDQILSAFPMTDSPRPAPRKTGLVEPLTEREMQTLHLLATELSTQEMADQMVVSIQTVRTHSKNLYGKLNAHSRAEAVYRAQELELI